MDEAAIPPRVVTVALCRDDGSVAGALPAFDVATPWWMDTGLVVDAVRERYGVEITVLRLVATGRAWPPHGGPVTYLAELADAGEVLTPGLPFEPVVVVDDGDPRRARWAKPGGVRALVGWADEALAALGRPRVGRAEQARTWNLSCIVKLPTIDGAAWLKAVPPFFAHEGALLRALAAAGDAALVPRVLASGRGVTLLDDIPGVDLYDASDETLLAMVELLVALQARWASRVDELLGVGVPDWRGPAIVTASEHLVSRPDVRERLEPDELTRVDALVAALPDRVAAVAACGVPDSLVHGDFHPGNWRGANEGALTLIDWGDSGAGNPLLDQAAFLSSIGQARAARVEPVWSAAWRRAVPGCDPERAAGLLKPVAALRQAMIYRAFLDGIERSEHCYHERDTEEWLRRAIS